MARCEKGRGVDLGRWNAIPTMSRGQQSECEPLSHPLSAGKVTEAARPGRRDIARGQGQLAQGGAPARLARGERAGRRAILPLSHGVGMRTIPQVHPYLDGSPRQLQSLAPCSLLRDGYDRQVAHPLSMYSRRWDTPARSLAHWRPLAAGWASSGRRRTARQRRQRPACGCGLAAVAPRA